MCSVQGDPGPVGPLGLPGRDGSPGRNGTDRRQVHVATMISMAIIVRKLHFKSYARPIIIIYFDLNQLLLHLLTRCCKLRTFYDSSLVYVHVYVYRVR